MIFLIRTSLLTIISFLISANLCFGQRAANPAASEYYNYADTTRKILSASEDELKVNVRIISDDVLEKYKKDPAFSYDNKTKEPEDWLTKIKNWVNQQIALLRSSKVYFTLLDYLYYFLMIIALVLILRGLVKADKRGLLFGSKINDEIKMTELEEDINQLNFDELIASAIEDKQYKLAVRYLFLKSLKMLSDKEIIELKNNKTNNQYLSEIKNNQIALLFKNNILLFEWIWFGDFHVNEDLMKDSRSNFNKLFGLLSAQ